MSGPRIATEHVWRTESGRHVPSGHPDARVLVAAPGDPIPDEVVNDDDAAQEAPRRRRKQEKAEPAADASDAGEKVESDTTEE